ncbi:ubiquinol-cytochrome C chaperone domain-containing protein [Hirsutella rhossiliensis]|uniref:Ubiquinol-cytochrome C chaperone domain-containing protein n=1 Tax=Hirsutella rhossiliensis TaxID=111463 RepID=A0A9P8N316_9HYPO|nr:ubiquinol-cytochrome C chaperone domain-containing protein [Hirsutella rhossiliensis]KAH0966748.1 ubiquinol-cytochrome C chaperone domain-containing protein [Hirsutella rhossiliensis]
MACERCRWQVRSLVQVASTARAAATRTTTTTTLTTRTSAPTTTKHHALLSPRTPSSWAQQHQHRWFSGTAEKRILGMGGSLAESYRVLGASERLYKVCSRAADYHITEEARKKDEVERLEDGEELGRPADKNNVWHKTFQLHPSFSTWSHVTMLHLYLLNARARCFEREAYRSWQQQLVDHFFFECEKKMHLDHNITSSALRQRYLKDIFVQWRGLLLAYDEGLIKGDAVLASAVWRNLFKGSPAVDPRALLAIVGWLRASLAALEATSDMVFAERAEEILAKPVGVFWTRLEEPFKQGAAAAESAATKPQRVPVQTSSPKPAAAA